MTIDRHAALRRAETLIGDRQFDQAIEEYLRLLDHDPNDRHAAMLLGDLYARVGRDEEAIDQFSGLALRFRHDGFLAKAAALYKKILKINPENDRVAIALADVAACQGLLADARSHLTVVGERRRSGGDHAGVAEIARLVADLPARWEVASSADRLRRPGAAPRFPDAGPPAVEASKVDDRQQTDPNCEKKAAVASPTEETGSLVPKMTALRPSQIEKPDEPPSPIESVFTRFRNDVGERLAIDPAEQAFTRGMALHAAGQIDDCIDALQVAASAPRRRAEVAALLGRIFRDRGNKALAIEWFERAADAPVATREAGYRLLYELADALEAAGETARALAVFVELQADAGDYEDLGVRIERLMVSGERW